MKINTVNEYRVEVELLFSEMARLGLSFESMDWADIETRRALWSLVGLMREQGVEVRLSGRLLIEAGRLPDGMRLCFTSLPRGRSPRLRLKKEPLTPVLRCERAADAENAALCLPHADCAIYRQGEACFLLIDGTYTEAQLARAAEFGSVSRAPMARAVLEEYCERIT